MYHTLLVVFFLVAISLVALIILQQGPDDIDNSFGLGASKTLFGSSGSSNFITRMTAFMAAIFFLLCLLLSIICNNKKPVLNSINTTTNVVSE
ncbi:preprotein translocase subunit SecG [Candidatus Palibaumannia cicadellinicola]|uniref:Protein-export membrane protein SecG n=1 Tax=Baumannia cicadellinicola subsp. Homalodisca coagulata TaxID=374463 RepID=Q1LSK6_BAUCH|nr:preprotein translocase subunit SecG [Candidatus Baumannia cicadellinicola]ABF13772.1 Protein-export membrane protein secG [Baumannia cicadellinicola str. Hc (Homalodisca coagulata)]MBS0032507.1 preprotein translocase subunit SecG [Candidatus Baumannia cicadellinicola]